MQVLILIIALLATEPPRKKLVCTGKVQETQTHFGGSDTHNYWLYFEDGTTVKTSKKYYACYERGDTAVFFFRHFYDKDGRYKRSEWQMYNKCPHELH